MSDLSPARASAPPPFGCSLKAKAWSPYVAGVVGGLLLGTGIALAGACPGTVLAQVGVGYRDALFTLLGGLAGATAFGYAEPSLAPLLLSGGPGKITFMDLTGLPYSVMAPSLAAVLVVVLAALERWRPWRADLGADVDGDCAAPAAADMEAQARVKAAE